MPNFHVVQSRSLIISLIHSIQENNGLIVNLSKKLEINPLVVVVGLSVLLKQCLIDYVLLQTNNSKLESQLKIYFHAVDGNVEWVAMEVILLLHGNTIKNQDLFLEIFMVMIHGVNHTNSHLVLTMFTVQNITIAHLMNIAPQVVKDHVKVVIQNHIVPIKDMDQVPTQLVLARFNLKSRPMVQLKLPSLYTPISQLTNPVFTNTNQEAPSVVTPSKLLDGVLKMVLITGLLLTPGMKAGETMVLLRF